MQYSRKRSPNKMSEDFENSPRSLKRRKCNTYGTSKSSPLANSTSTSSIWDNVSSGVTGLSRRLFAGTRPRKSTQAENVPIGFEEVTPAPVEVHAQGEEELEIPESQDEHAEPAKKLRRKNAAHECAFESPPGPLIQPLKTPIVKQQNVQPMKSARKSSARRSLKAKITIAPLKSVEADNFAGGDDSNAVAEYALQEDELSEESAEEPAELLHIKNTVLARLTLSANNIDRQSLPTHLLNAYETLHNLLQTTISSGESNSLLLLGSRGSGKSLLVNVAIDALRRTSSTDFHIIRLNGFVQTDDRLALREIWRQLGREMDVDEEETNQVVGSYADTMTSLLGLLSQPEEVPDIGTVEYVAEKVVTRSVVFILDEFDLFTTHPRQTLLYNLFDIAQSRKAPIAVIGCSARTDCVDCLEKRVKSRFSHRWVHVGHPKSLAAFEEVARDNLLMSEKQVGVEKQELEWRAKWNEYIKVSSV